MRYQGKYFAPSQRKPVAVSGILTRIAALLLCFVTASACMMSGLLAKYSTTGSGSDEARVAKFEVVATGVSPNTISVTCTNYDGNTGSCTFTVTNSSEVTVQYKMWVNFEPNVDYVAVKLDDGEAWELNGTLGYVAPTSCTLTPGQSVNHTITFNVNWDLFTKEASNSSAFTKDINFTITLSVEQVD